MISKVLLFIYIVVCSFGSLSADILCEEGFCRGYIFDPGCAAPAQECSINNATHNGIHLLSPTICNCCEYCMPIYGENAHCSVTGTGNGLAVGRCGDGLTCVPGDGGNFCQKMSADHSVCHAKQDDYDQRHLNGETGALEYRPHCDGKGRFAAFDCVPTQTCFCQSEDGKRIFGEVLYQGRATQQNMHCGCSRVHYKIAQTISSGLRFPTIAPRCTADGNFNPMQCLGRNCFCVDPVTGARNGDALVDLNEHPLTALPCYDRSIDLFSDFYPNELPFNYTSPCYDEMMDKIDLILTSEEEGYNVDFFSSVTECLPDGTYSRIATTVNGTKICVNERQEQLENYEAYPGTKEFDEMNCKCAVTSSLMESSNERPVCCSNGNFRPVQCRRGLCRCVDEDGRQTVKEVSNVRTLPCFTEDWLTC